MRMKGMSRLDNNNIDYKHKLLDTGIFKFQSNSRYTSQCPFCNDNKKHMYVLIDLNSDMPVLYNCFKCNAKGKMNTEFLKYFGIEDITIPRSKFKKKIEPNKASSTLSVSVDDTDTITDVCNYIKDRVGQYPSLTDLQYFQYVGKPFDYSKEYLGNDKDSKVFNNRYWFRMTNGNIIGRYNSDDTSYRWLKYKSKYVNDDKGLYTLKIPFDLHQTINVYIAEGVMDIIGLYYNYIHDNNVYIATMGKNYTNGIHHLVDMGIFGDNVNIKIFKDPDVRLDKIYIDRNLKGLFGKVDIYHNITGKDYGVLPDELEIQKCIK